MKILLDTCAIIWAITQPEKLSEKGTKALTNKQTVVYFSPISAGEIACLSERGRVEFDRHWKTWFNHFIETGGWNCLDISLDIIQEAYSLPGIFHQDPADRIIVATARYHNLTVVTGDKKILDYPHVKTI
ncbi:MAG: type II toxin-antitoxin system VapC family toxin [Deltaproteobacteria bacterium]|nr:type II toxin-antitoxin system VapC family toxin [Deltaproteobacteria bacterium]